MKRYQCMTCGRFCKAPEQGPYGHDYDPYCEQCAQNAWEDQQERDMSEPPIPHSETIAHAWRVKYGFDPR